MLLDTTRAFDLVTFLLQLQVALNERDLQFELVDLRGRRERLLCDAEQLFLWS